MKTKMDCPHCYLTATATDPLGNVYTTGTFKETVDFDPNETAVDAVSSYINLYDYSVNGAFVSTADKGM